jgi:hypothetical protein
MRALLLAALLLCGCRESPAETATIVDSANPLEAAARDANLVADPATTLPTGLFERHHAVGSDSLCFVPEGDERYRFALVARFGETLTCEGSGSARHEGSRVSLAFSGGGCTIDAEYDGNNVRLPGTVPSGCSAYCGPRASLSGVAVERVGWTREDALPRCNANIPKRSGTG